MNIVFIVILIILIIAIIVTLGFLTVKVESQNKVKTTKTLWDILDSKGFYPTEIHFVNKHLSLALNKAQNKLAIIKNFNPNNPYYFEQSEIALSFIEKIEKNIALKIYYIKKGEIKTLNIYPPSAEIKDFLHRVFELSLIKKIEAKYPEQKFSAFTSSDWECSHIWAFSKRDCVFAYLKTGKKYYFGKLNLKKEHITLDTKFQYFEAPIFGIAQQLFFYDKTFLDGIFSALFEEISQKCGQIAQNSIYYDNYSNIIYITNGTTSLQSVMIDKIEDVYYRDNRLSFSLPDSKRMINYISNQQQISDFEDFVINYNLKKIAHNFDHRTDKLINTTPYTKFIIDFSRSRVIYCANLNKFARFSFIIISFENLIEARAQKSGMKHFVRIFTTDREIIDVTCDKLEVAQYIEACIGSLKS